MTLKAIFIFIAWVALTLCCMKLLAKYGGMDAFYRRLLWFGLMGLWGWCCWCGAQFATKAERRGNAAAPNADMFHFHEVEVLHNTAESLIKQSNAATARHDFAESERLHDEAQRLLEKAKSLLKE